jgi:hypothetical protein
MDRIDRKRCTNVVLAGPDLAGGDYMKSNELLAEIRVEFYHSSGHAVPIPSVGDTFQGMQPNFTDAGPTYVVERRHFHIASGHITARIYGRDIQVTGGL